MGKIPAKNPSIEQWFTTVAKIYYNTDEKFSAYRIWVDDLEIYSGHLVSTAPAPVLSIPSFRLELIIVAIMISSAAVIIVRRRWDLVSSHG